MGWEGFTRTGPSLGENMRRGRSETVAYLDISTGGRTGAYLHVRDHRRVV